MYDKDQVRFIIFCINQLDFVCINSLAGLLGSFSRFSSYVIKYLVAGAAVYGTRDVGTEGSKIHIWVIQVIGKLPDGLKRNDVALCMF